MKGADATTLDQYQGMYKKQLDGMYEAVAPERMMQHWDAFSEKIAAAIDAEGNVSSPELADLQQIAKQMSMDIHDQQRSMRLLGADVIADSLNDIQRDLLGVSGKDVTTSQLQTLNQTLIDIRSEGKKMVSAIYSSVDPEGKIKVRKAASAINDYLSNVSRDSSTYQPIRKKYSEAMYGYLERVLSGSDKDLPDILNREHFNTDPTELFHPSALTQTKGDVVYMSVNEFQRMVGSTSEAESAKVAHQVESASNVKLKQVPSVKLELDDNGKIRVVGSGGRLSAETVKSMSKKSKGNTLIPVSLEMVEGSGLLQVIREGDVTTNIIPMGRKNAGDNRTVNVKLKKQLESQDVSLRIKRGELEMLGEMVRTTFKNPEQTDFSKDLINLDNVEWSYREADLFHKSVRKLKNEANNSDRSDFMDRENYHMLDEELGSVVKGELAKDSDASMAYDLATGLYKDEIVPYFTDPTHGVLGKVTDFKKNGMNGKLMSTIWNEIKITPELEQQLIQLGEPEKFSLFSQLLESPELLGKLTVLEEMLGGTEAATA